MNNFDDFNQNVFEEDDVINSAAGGILPAGSGSKLGLFEDGASQEGSQQEAEHSAAELDEIELTSLLGDETAQDDDSEITDSTLTGQRATQSEAVQSIASPAANQAPVSLAAMQVELGAAAAAPADTELTMQPDTGPTQPAAAGVGAPDLGAPAAPGTLATLAQYLNDSDAGGADFWDDFGVSLSPYFNLTGAGSNAKSGVIHYNVTGFSGISGAGTDANGITAARADMIRHALNVYEDILGINFVETTLTSTGVVDIYFKDNASGAFANFAGQAVDGSIQYSYVNIASSWDGGNSAIGTYSFQTALHEIGHVLGLGHQGNYNAGAGSPTYATSAQWQNDSWQQTMMSYWSQTANTDITASYARLIGPMAVDWLALENLYGGQGYGVANGATTGNTTWGFNSSWIDWTPSSGGPVQGYSNTAYASMDTLLATSAVAIVDGGGIDTLDLSGFSNNTRIDVSEALATSTVGSNSNVAGKIGNLTIAVGTIIENVIGGSGSELIYGNNANNNLDGNGGSDTIYGYAGNDTLTGDAGNDYLFGGTGIDSILGGAGNDTIYLGGNNGDYADGGSGDDQIYGGLNNQTLLGGLGNDTIYGDDATPTSGIGDTIYGGSGSDSIVGANGGDSLEGGYGNDTIVGNSGDDTIEGGFASDSVNAGAGNDLIRVLNNEFYDSVDGGTGNDTLDHSGSSYSGDVFNFQTGLITGAHTSNPSATLANIETYLDGSGANTIHSDGSGLFDGNGGDDTIYAGLGVSETLDGGIGTDLLDTTTFIGNYTIDMTTGVTNFAGESFVNFENLITGSGNDILTGTTGDNVIDGGAGHDTLDGSDGSGGYLAGHDTLLGGAGNDVLNYSMYSSGSSAVGTYDGGTGTDTFWVSNASLTAGRTVDLAAGLFRIGVGVSRGILLNIENVTVANATAVIGDGGANVITGTGDFANSFIGNAGDDTLIGFDGDDTLDGGADNDTLMGGHGDDSLVGDSGDDSLHGGAQSDTLDGGTGTDTLDGGGGGDTLLGRGGNDVMDGGDGGDDLSGGHGNDNMSGGTGSDVLDGGDGNDTLNGGTGADGLLGGDGDDTLLGGIGNDTLKGNADNDSLMGEAGDDSLLGGSGDDTLDGGAENDTVEGGGGGDAMDGGTGDDLLSYKSDITGVDVNLGTGSASGGHATGDTFTGFDDLEGGKGSDTLTGSVADNHLNGKGQSDLLNGWAGNDTLLGGNGADTLLGGADDDLMKGSSGDDSLDGGTGNDTLNGGIGEDTLKGKGGEDLLNGGTKNDILIGGGGNDTLDGGTGKDTLTGGGGDDLMTGGNSADDFIFADNFGTDIITDFAAANGEDIDLSAVSAITGFNDLMNNHLVNNGGFAQIVDGANSILLDGVAFSDVGVGNLYSADDFIF